MENKIILLTNNDIATKVHDYLEETPRRPWDIHQIFHSDEPENNVAIVIGTLEPTFRDYLTKLNLRIVHFRHVHPNNYENYVLNDGQRNYIVTKRLDKITYEAFKLDAYEWIRTILTVDELRQMQIYYKIRYDKCEKGKINE